MAFVGLWRTFYGEGALVLGLVDVAYILVNVWFLLNSRNQDLEETGLSQSIIDNESID